MHSQTCGVSSESILSVLLGNAINCCHKAIEVERTKLFVDRVKRGSYTWK